MTRRPARAAFTLIELLVVISIITVISAITVGVFGRVRANSMKSATDATLNKINNKIGQRIKAINDQVADDVKSRHPGYAAVLAQVGGQADLAKTLWTYGKMRNELPMSFVEAKNPTTVYGSAIIPPKAVFAALPAGTPGGSPEESAVCLYLAVTANAGGGTASDADGLDQQTGATTAGLKCFKDAWGTPIAFVRTAYNTEVNSPPFVRAGSTFDPFDPRGKLVTYTGTWTAGSLAAWWTAIKPPVTWAGADLALNTYPGARTHTWTAISAGPDRKWAGPAFPNDPFGLPPIPDTDSSKDNQLSYRLRREGARGD